MFGNEYELVVMSWGALALLMLLQVTAVDVTSIRAKHTPGAPVTADHGNFLFRVTRTVANTNETIAIYIVVVLYCIYSGANADYTGYLSWTYVTSRAAYAVCYYTNQQIPRSICFAISLLALLGMLIIGFFS